MKCLIFDCGGVLAYPRPGDWFTPLRVAEIIGARANDLHTARGRAARRDSAPWLDESRLVRDMDEEFQLRREYISSLDRRLNWRMTNEEIEALADDFTRNPDRFGFFDGAGEWLARWKREYRLGMLSDAMPSTLAFMEHGRLLALLDAAVISTQIGATKPDPRMYAAIADALDAAPEDCLFVDDRAANVEGAVAAGMCAVQMAHPAFPPDALWDGPVARGFEPLDALLREGAVWRREAAL